MFNIEGVFMKSFFELLAAIFQLLIYVVIFALQVLAPLMTLIFLIVTFINPNNVTMTIFYVSAISYFVGYLTSSLGMKSVVPIYEKSLLDRRHPVLSTILNMVVMFVPSFLVALIICLIFSDFTYYLHNAIMVNWFYRLIKFFLKNKEQIQIQNGDLEINDQENLGIDNRRTKPLSEAELRKNVEMLGRVFGSEKSTDEVIEEFNQWKEKRDPKMTKDVEQDNVQVDENDEDYKYLMTREKDLQFTAASLTYGFMKIKKDLKVSSAKAIFGSLFISQKTWLEANILTINDIVDMLTDARSSVCTLENYQDVHGYGTPFTDEIDFLTNLSMTDSCKSISINKPEIEHEKIIDFIIENKDFIKQTVKDAMKDNYDFGMMKSIIEITTENGMKQYEKLIKGFKEEGIQPE